jgi:hypothetical protein
MKSDRLIELLEKASKALEDGQDPFHVSFLQDNNVTLNEVYDLSMAMSAAIDLFLIPIRRTKLMEECAELIKAICKAKRFGWKSRHPDRPYTDNLQEVFDEIGDVEQLIKQFKDERIKAG